jgi:hypothetical protein
VTQASSDASVAPQSRPPAPAARDGRTRLQLLGQRLPGPAAVDTRPDWEQAEPRWIRSALQRSLALPSGGWYVIDAAASITATPRAVWVKGRQLVVWRDADTLRAAPEACPHMGASLAGARVCQGRLVCPWHGLELGPEGHSGWKPLRTHDDGVLAWVRLPDADEQPSERPFLAARPARPLGAVIRVEAACEPRDVIQNRLDPWHGAHFHPHSFAHLRVVDQQTDEVTVRVAYRLLGPLAVEVDARFHCPDPRTIVMTIVAGEGEGSVVETHATPMRSGHTAIVEATLATSERRGFELARRSAHVLQPLMRWAARRLWTEDAAYAERLYALRGGR